MSMLNPADFGFSAEATAAQNANALTSALVEANGAPVVMQAGNFSIDAVEYTGPINLTGSGIHTRLKSVSSGAGIHVKVPTFDFGSVLGNFTINHETPAGGTHGIHIETTSPTGYFARFRIFDIYNDLVGISGFGTSALYLDNSIGSPGFATGIIEGCQLTTGVWAGIHGDLVGDSIKISRNVVNGGSGIALDMKLISMGARQLVIEDNNFTARGGQILLDGCAQASVHRNWMEHPGYMGNFVPARITSQMVLWNCYNCCIDQNTINGKAGAAVGSNYGIGLTGTTQRTRTRDNFIAGYELSAIVDTTGSAGSAANTTSQNTVV